MAGNFFWAFVASPSQPARKQNAPLRLKSHPPTTRRRTLQRPRNSKASRRSPELRRTELAPVSFRNPRPPQPFARFRRRRLLRERTAPRTLNRDGPISAAPFPFHLFHFNP